MEEDLNLNQFYSPQIFIQASNLDYFRGFFFHLNSWIFLWFFLGIFNSYKQFPQYDHTQPQGPQPFNLIQPSSSSKSKDVQDGKLKRETPEEAKRRFEIECEFVQVLALLNHWRLNKHNLQSLANPHYLHCKWHYLD